MALIGHHRGRRHLRRHLHPRRHLGSWLAIGALAAVGGALALPSAASTAAAAAPRNTGEPAISGRAEQGRRLSSSRGSWSGTSPISYAYRWLRCGADGGRPDGSDCIAVASAAAVGATGCRTKWRRNLASAR